MVANDLRSDPAVCSLARVVRENKGVVYSAPPEALAEVCGLAGRLRRPVSELEEDVWAAEAAEAAAATAAPAVHRSLSGVVGPAAVSSLSTAVSSLSDEAQEELMCLEAMWGIDGKFRRKTASSFQLLVDGDDGGDASGAGAAGWLVLEVTLPTDYPAEAPAVRIHGSSRVRGASLSGARKASAANALHAFVEGRAAGEPLLVELHEEARRWLEAATPQELESY